MTSKLHYKLVKIILIITGINLLITACLHILMEMYANLFQVDKLSLGFLGLLLCISLGSILLSVYKFTQVILSPVQEIIGGIHEIQSGNTSHRIAITTEDEFQEIGDMLNRTAEMMNEKEKVCEQILQREKKKKIQLLNVYSKVISAVTQGKFNLLNSRECDCLSDEGDFLGSIELSEPEDINAARMLVKYVLDQRQYPVQNLMHIQLCVSEAATNVLKHAQTGELQIRMLTNRLRIVVSDQGQGMEYDKLPQMIFYKGFSTKISMGVGYSLIYKYADQISLHTSEEGTDLIMDFLLEGSQDRV